MKIEGVFTQNRRLWVRLRENGGNAHAMPCHHSLVPVYLSGADRYHGDDKWPPFRTIARATGALTTPPLPQSNAYAMIRRRAAGTETDLGNHSFRPTGITAYLKSGGTLVNAAAVANNASTWITELYDHRRDEIKATSLE